MLQYLRSALQALPGCPTTSGADSPFVGLMNNLLLVTTDMRRAAASSSFATPAS